MKALIRLVVAGFAGIATAAAYAADESSLSFGGDEYRGGQHVSISQPVAHDAFAAGYDAAVAAPVTGNAHLAGYNVSVTSDVGGDLYAAGFSVVVTGSVQGAVTAFGNNVSIHAAAPIGGNARLAGATVSIGSPLAASALVATGSLVLDAPVSGDLSFYGDSISFGPSARVDGRLLIHAPAEIAVPASVASADRVSFEVLSRPDYVQEAGKTATNVVGGYWALWVAATWWLVLLVIGAALIALMPRRLAAMATVSARRPFRNFGVGLLAFASVLGLLPLCIITVVGLLLLPFVLILVLLAASLAYLAGAYFIGLRIGRAFVPVDSNLARLGILAVALLAALLLGMIPVIGWLLTLVIVTFGFGVVAVVTMVRWSAGDAARLQAQPAPAS